MSMLTVHVSSSISKLLTEKRFDKALTILALKEKLELITGSTATYSKLELHNDKGQLVCVMGNDAAMLGSYPIEDFMRIHVVDQTPGRTAGEFEDTSKVEKFEISTEDYAQREDSVRAFKERNKMGRFAEDYEEKMAEKDREGEEEASKMKVGDRCEVTVKNNIPRRGEVLFVGKTDFKAGWWVGVKYDEPLGKNDGSVEGKRYFTCPAKHGGFARPHDVAVGDFPEEDLFSDDEM